MHHPKRDLRQFGYVQDIPQIHWYHQNTWVQISHNIVSMNAPDYRPIDTRDWEYVYNRIEQLVIDCENFGYDQQLLRETQARARVIGCEVMNFSSAQYQSVQVGPANITRSNAFTEVGRSSVYAEHGPSTIYAEAGPSSIYPETASTVYTPDARYMPFVHDYYTHNVNQEIRRQYVASLVPFESTELNTLSDHRDDNPP
ncbi:UNVERIFIED_CONTAM: hypothetical protein Sindi_1709100 [Sesamum indicum]